MDQQSLLERAHAWLTANAEYWRIYPTGWVSVDEERRGVLQRPDVLTFKPDPEEEVKISSVGCYQRGSSVVMGVLYGNPNTYGTRLCVISENPDGSFGRSAGETYASRMDVHREFSRLNEAQDDVVRSASAASSLANDPDLGTETQNREKGIQPAL